MDFRGREGDDFKQVLWKLQVVSLRDHPSFSAFLFPFFAICSMSEVSEITLARLYTDPSPLF